MLDDTKSFSEQMAERRLKLTKPMHAGAEARPRAFTTLSQKIAMERNEAPFKKFTPKESGAQVPRTPVADVAAPALHADEVKPKSDIDAAVKTYLAARVMALKGKVDRLEEDVHARLTSRFGLGNEWRAFADAAFLDFYAAFERIERKGA